jgi:hypothetical protein
MTALGRAAYVVLTGIIFPGALLGMIVCLCIMGRNVVNTWDNETKSPSYVRVR